MAEVSQMLELANYIRSIQSGTERASALAFVATMNDAEQLAKQNAIRQFTGRNGRHLSGTLLNSIYSRSYKTSAGLEGVLGVRDIPYASIHEYGSAGLPGGVIKPKPSNKMQKLWIPNYPVAKRMTPREFFQFKQANPNMYAIAGNVAGKVVRRTRDKTTIVPLFFLVSEVTIPARPYLTPAIEMATDSFPTRLDQFLAGELDG